MNTGIPCPYDDEEIVNADMLQPCLMCEKCGRGYYIDDGNLKEVEVLR